MFSRTLALVLLSLSLPACKVVIDNSGGGGHVVSQSGTYSCESGESCEIDVSDDSFDEGFHAVPDEGQVFLGWRKGEGSFCGGVSQDCLLSTVGFNNSPELKSVLDSDETFYLRPRFDQVNSQTILQVKWDAVEDCSQPCYAIKVDGRYSRTPAVFDGASTIGVISHEIGEKSQDSYNSFTESYFRDAIPELPDGSSCDNGKKFDGSSDFKLEYKIVTRQVSHGRVDLSVEIENSASLISGDERSYRSCFEPWVAASYSGKYLEVVQTLDVYIKLNMPYGKVLVSDSSAELTHDPRNKDLCYQGECGSNQGGVDIAGLSRGLCGPESDGFIFSRNAFFYDNEPMMFSDSLNTVDMIRANGDYGILGPALCTAPFPLDYGSTVRTIRLKTNLIAATIGDPTSWYEGAPYDSTSMSVRASLSISLRSE